MIGSYSLQDMGMDAAVAALVLAGVYAAGFVAVFGFMFGYAVRKEGRIRVGRDKLRFVLAAGRLWPRLLPAMLQDVYDSNH